MATERLLLWSAACLPGVHLPVFAARAEGLDVELVESAPGAGRVDMLARGAGDFLLTATLYHLQALAGAGPRGLPVRAVAVVHQRSPVAAVVRADSALHTPADLVGRRLGTPVAAQMGWLGREVQAALPGPVDVVDLSYPDAFAALAAGDIDLVANFTELLAIDRHRAGVELRAIPLGAEVYSSSLLAAEGVSDDRVATMMAALSATFELQRLQPTRGIAELCREYPTVDPVDAAESWHALEPFIFDGPGDPLGPGDPAGWERTIAWAARVHGLRSTATRDVLGAAPTISA